jgi:hypothetical protein
MGRMSIDYEIKQNYKIIQGLKFIDKFKEAVVKSNSGKQFYQYLKSVSGVYKGFCDSIEVMANKEYEAADDELIKTVKHIQELIRDKEYAEIDVKYDKKALDGYKKELEERPDSDYYKHEVERYTGKYNNSMSKLNAILKEIESYTEARKSNLYKMREFNRLLVSKYEDFNEDFEEMYDIKKDRYADKLEGLKQNLNLFDEVKSLLSSNDQLVQYKKEYDKASKDLEKKIRDRMRKLKDTKPNESTQMRHDFVKKYVHECFEEFMSEYYSYENVFGDYMED